MNAPRENTARAVWLLGIVLCLLRAVAADDKALSKRLPARRDADSGLCCEDLIEDWKDKNGDSCLEYEDFLFCTLNGTPGPIWKSRWGSFADYASRGLSATDVCCACGGGKACEVGEGGGEVASAGEGLKPPPKSPVESTERALPGEEGVGQNAMAMSAIEGQGHARDDRQADTASSEGSALGNDDALTQTLSTQPESKSSKANSATSNDSSAASSESKAKGGGTFNIAGRMHVLERKMPPKKTWTLPTETTGAKVGRDGAVETHKLSNSPIQSENAMAGAVDEHKPVSTSSAEASAKQVSKKEMDRILYGSFFGNDTYKVIP
mmetsp:Transcript_13129/g.47908  ORF Transcript_13129/g.47908 Transcript_13129/m.47908 type:complete len:323 (-) Transcript_13129:889-1857(-)